MAVEAQYPCNAFSPDLRSSRAAMGTVLQEMPERNMVDSYAHVGTGGTVFSDLQKSELTCNVSAPCRKRIREQHQLNPNPNMSALPRPPKYHVSSCNSNTNTNSNINSNRLMASGLASTSGRLPISANNIPIASDLNSIHPFMQSYNMNHMCLPSCPAVLPPPSPSSILDQEILSHFQRLTSETDSLVRLEMEKMRIAVEEAKNRQCEAMLAELGRGPGLRLREKQLELEDLVRRNTELEQRVRQVGAENEVWFNMAKKNEAIATQLRSSLQQLQDNLHSHVPSPHNAPPAEGFGDSDEAQSGYHEDPAPPASAGQWTCKLCLRNDVTQLLLPCRHLCLCQECEPTSDTCPVCHGRKNSSVRIFFC